jgi:hypothetical protein
MTNMTVSRLSRRTNDSGYIPVLWFTILFAVVTYAAVSLRAVLSPFEVNSFIDAKRGLSVAIGAFILWLSIRAPERQANGGPGAQVFAVLNVAIPGAIGLLLAREAYDLAASGELAQRLALNVRWMLTWIGYFAAAVAAFLALGYHRQLQAVTAQRSARVEDADMRSTPRAQAGYEVADIEFDPRASNQHH